MSQVRVCIAACIWVVLALFATSGAGTAADTPAAIDVRSHGAVGDGATDDTAAIQAAENKAAQTGSSLFFPKGTYLISSGLTSDSPVEWNGAGEGSVIKASASSYSILTLGSNADGKKIRNLKFLGGATDDSTRQFAIFTVSSPDRVEISGCSFYNTNSGIKNADGNNWNVHHNKFEKLVGVIGGTGYGYLSGDGADYNVIDSNTYIGSPGYGRHAVYISAGGSYNKASNNTVISCNSVAIQVYSKAAQGTARNNIVENNRIFGGGNIKNNDAAALTVICNAENNSVINNEIYGFNNSGIQVDDYGCSTKVSGNTVSGNIVYNVGLRGIQLVGTKDTVITGNRIYNPSASSPGKFPGISLFSVGSSGKPEVTDGTNITGNTVWGTTQRAGVLINTTAPVAINTKIVGNVFLGGSTAQGRAIEIPERAEVRMSGNATGSHLSKTATVDFSEIAAYASEDRTVSLAGVEASWPVIAAPAGSPESGIMISSWASSKNTVTIRATNATAGAINPASRTFRLDVWKQ